MDYLTLFTGLSGLVFLVGGAEVLVRGAAGLARRIGASELLIGMTVVAFGTSAPELLVSLDGGDKVAVGNVVGSNIFNVLAILGPSALIYPIVVERKLIRRDIPLLVGISFATLGFGWDGTIFRWEGLAFLVGFAGYHLYSWFELRAGRGQTDTEAPPLSEPNRKRPSVVSQLGLVVLGLGLLVLGSQWFVEAVKSVARTLEISETMISLTIVAAGTSLPELATSVIASFRQNSDIAVGNIVGSNIFNLLGILGLSAVVADAGLPLEASIVHFDIPIMIAVAVVCLPIFVSGGKIDRWEGGVFVLYYATYVTYTYLYAVRSDKLGDFSLLVFAAIVPLTVLTVVVVHFRDKGN